MAIRPDGNWFWDGSNWVPAPNTQSPNQASQIIPPLDNAFAAENQPSQNAPTNSPVPTQVAYQAMPTYPQAAFMMSHKEARKRTCPDTDCRTLNHEEVARCAVCDTPLRRRGMESFVWYALCACTAYHMFMMTFGLTFDPFWLRASIGILTFVQEGLKLVFCATALFWIGRALQAMGWNPKGIFDAEILQRRWMRFIIRFVSLIAGYAFVYMGAGLIITKLFGVSLVWIKTFNGTLVFFLLPAYGFLIGFLEFNFLYGLPRREGFLSRYINTPNRLRAWDSFAFFVVAFTILTWRIADFSLIPNSVSTFGLLFVQPVLLLLTLRDIPEQVPATSVHQRQRVIIPLYLIVLANLAGMISISIWYSGVDTVSRDFAFSTGTIGMGMAMSEATRLVTFLTSLLSLSEFAGIILAIIFIYIMRYDHERLHALIERTMLIAIGLAILIVIPLAAISATVYDETPSHQLGTDIFTEEQPLYISIAIPTKVDTEVVLHILAPTTHVLTGFTEDHPCKIEHQESLTLEGGSSTMYLKYPVGEYLYSDKVAPLSESTPISVYRITISEFEHTYISFTLTFEMTDPNSSYENPKLGMSFLEYEDELVDWRILT
ncbi:MAG: hypothetical protein QF885_07780 [Candidatus Thalassarchaeaceae archaeon]|nr:hypothetical protein [Candidatus Thalassarchaeaceae archaeon]